MGKPVNLLAIETATTSCAIGLQCGDRLESRVLDTQRRHTEVLTEGISALLAECALRARDLERVVVDRGPGLFTGLRVGLATAQALARGRGIDLVGVSSLELLAYGAWRHERRGSLVAVVDARRGELFAQNFVLDEGVRATSEPHVTTALALSIIFATSGDNVTFTGDGAKRYCETLDVVANIVRFDQDVPSVLDALALGAQRPPSEEVTPLYLREADAVANFSTRQRPS